MFNWTEYWYLKEYIRPKLYKVQNFLGVWLFLFALFTEIQRDWHLGSYKCMWIEHLIWYSSNLIKCTEGVVWIDWRSTGISALGMNFNLIVNPRWNDIARIGLASSDKIFMRQLSLLSITFNTASIFLLSFFNP